MALETLNGVDMIGTEPVKHLVASGLQEALVNDGLKKAFSGANIIINDKLNIIAFKLQNGPINTYGKNGCQVDDLIRTAMQIIQGLNRQYPCSQNEDCLRSLDVALEHLASRKKNREARGVEGYEKC
jgi:hypothetical protein